MVLESSTARDLASGVKVSTPVFGAARGKAAYPFSPNGVHF